MDNFELRAAMAAAKAESLERISQIEADVMPHVIAAELRGYPLGDYQPPKPRPPAPTFAEVRQMISEEIASALVEQRTLSDARQAAVGKVLGQVRAQLREEMVAAVGELRADLTIERAGDNAKVIDMPNPLRDRRA